MKSSKKSKTISLTRIKQWYLPVDAESYNILKAAGCPLIRIHENFIPTLKLITAPRHIKAHLIDFNDGILHPYLDNLGAIWQKRQYRVATIKPSTLRFETTHASILIPSRAALEKIEESLRRFFTRWGYQSQFEMSESRGKCRLHVVYKYDSTRLPVIPLVEDPATLPTVTLNLGFLRLRVTMGEKEIETNVSMAAGPDWTSLQTSRSLYSQVSDVRPFVNTLMRVLDKDCHNFDNKIPGNPVAKHDTPRPAAPPEPYHVVIETLPLTDEDKGVTRTKEVRVPGCHSKIINGENLRGNTTNVFGDAKNASGDVSLVSGDLTNVGGNLSCCKGTIDPRLGGNLTFVVGNISNIWGIVRDTVRGDVSGFKGDMTGLHKIG